MATVQLDRRGWEDGDLPDVCMQCGGDTTYRVRQTFVWQPTWVIFTIFVHVLLFIIISLVVRKKRNALVPMCNEHRNHWRKRTFRLWSSFASAIVVGGLGIAAVNTFGPDDPIAAICGVVVFTLFAWIVGVVVIQWGTIRPTEITDRSLGLKNVSPEFVDAYEHFLDEEESRHRQKVRLDDEARRLWNEPPKRREYTEDDPPQNDNIRPG